MPDATPPARPPRPPADALHDLNNLLTVIGGYAALLAESPPAGEHAAWASEIERAAKAAIALVAAIQSSTPRPGG